MTFQQAFTAARHESAVNSVPFHVVKDAETDSWEYADDRALAYLFPGQKPAVTVRPMPLRAER